MKALLTFASAIADSIRLRLLALVQEHKMSNDELAAVLKQPLPELAKELTILVESGLLKQAEAGQPWKLKRNYASVLDGLFSRFSLSAKKDATLRKDASQAKELRKAKRAAKKLMDKISDKKVEPGKSKVKAKTQPKAKAKTKAGAKTKTKAKAKAKA